MDTEKLRSMLELHGKWVAGESGGIRANLSRADLSRANLSGANLSGANLSRADLSRANLSGANLSWADLSRADLSGADLSGADLSEVDLDYGVWPLWCGSLKVGRISDRLALQLLAHVARLPTVGLSPEVSAVIRGLPELAKNGFCEYRKEVNKI